MGIDVPVKTLNDNTTLLTHAHDGDAGVDLQSTEEISLAPLERATVSCGISLAIPRGYAGLVIPRSGLASKHGISIVNGPGLIDSGYRGEIKVVLINLDPNETFHIKIGDRIAQLVIVAIPDINFVSVDELPQSERGTDGFGSSGI